MKETPPVSCFCPTYGRPRDLLAEAVESFLRQDYKGRRELIILNDLPERELARSIRRTRKETRLKLQTTFLDKFRRAKSRPEK